MSDKETTPQSDDQLIQVAAMLSQAAATDPRMDKLAKEARDMVLKSETALAELFIGYMKSKVPPPQVKLPTRNTTNEALALVNQAKQLIEGGQ